MNHPINFKKVVKHEGIGVNSCLKAFDLNLDEHHLKENHEKPLLASNVISSKMMRRKRSGERHIRHSSNEPRPQYAFGSRVGESPVSRSQNRENIPPPQHPQHPVMPLQRKPSLHLAEKPKPIPKPRVLLRTSSSGGSTTALGDPVLRKPLVRKTSGVGVKPAFGSSSSARPAASAVASTRQSTDSRRSRTLERKSSMHRAASGSLSRSNSTASLAAVPPTRPFVAPAAGRGDFSATSATSAGVRPSTARVLDSKPLASKTLEPRPNTARPPVSKPLAAKPLEIKQTTSRAPDTGRSHVALERRPSAIRSERPLVRKTSYGGAPTASSSEKGKAGLNNRSSLTRPLVRKTSNCGAVNSDRQKSIPSRSSSMRREQTPRPFKANPNPFSRANDPDDVSPKRKPLASRLLGPSANGAQPRPATGPTRRVCVPTLDRSRPTSASSQAPLQVKSASSAPLQAKSAILRAPVGDRQHPPRPKPSDPACPTGGEVCRPALLVKKQGALFASGAKSRLQRKDQVKPRPVPDKSPDAPKALTARDLQVQSKPRQHPVPAKFIQPSAPSKPNQPLVQSKPLQANVPDVGHTSSVALKQVGVNVRNEGDDEITLHLTGSDEVKLSSEFATIDLTGEEETASKPPSESEESQKPLAKENAIDNKYLSASENVCQVKRDPLCFAEQPLSVGHISSIFKSVIKEADKISIKDFEVGKSLGSGRSGHVYLARLRKNGFVCAIKLIYKNSLDNLKAKDQLYREVDIQYKLRHPHILRLYTYFEDDKRVFIVLEFAPKGELYAYLKKCGRFEDRQAAKYIKQMASALIYCQRNNVIHRDIKPENILISKNGDLKIADFGWSVQSNNESRQTLCGTIDYIPPEMLAGKEYSHAVDHWSLGVLLYEFLVGVAPFLAPEREETFLRIAQIDLKIPISVSSEATDIISRLLKYNPDERMTLEELLAHPWIHKT